MKFGKQFEFHKIPEWAEYYLDYSELKRLLKEVLNSYRKGKFPYYIFKSKKNKFYKKEFKENLLGKLNQMIRLFHMVNLTKICL
jgi:SPX domain protein involved in polyphosphate accumulation